MTKSFEEKMAAYSAYVADEARRQGKVFVEDSGDGRDLLLDDMYVEDIFGWLSPIEAPENSRKNDEYYCCAEWELVDNEVKVKFVKY